MQNNVVSPQKGLVLTHGVHEICMGAKCKIRHPGHTGPRNVDEYRACNGQEAEVVGFNPIGEKGLCSVNIRLETGPCKGRIVDNVDTKHLDFIELQKVPDVAGVYN